MSASAIDKFRGALVGALVGDCAGRPFEFMSFKKEALQEFFDSHEESNTENTLLYSDDTKMTIGVAESLVEMNKLDPVHMAKRFAYDYYENPGIGYSGNVSYIFKELVDTDFSGDVFKPAKKQFAGMGSWGNGGAMRISPVPLFCFDNYDLMIETATKCTKLTHTHKLGINGALLQAICVYKCFHHDSQQPIDIDDFVQDVIIKLENIEKNKSLIKKLAFNLSSSLNKLRKINTSDPNALNKKLNKVISLLKKEDVSEEDVVEHLGNGISALNSVPTALYCFLRAQKPIEGLETENVFRRTISYCISLRGDTDTIASMAGAMCGAYLGLSCISKGLQDSCQGIKEMINLSDRLYSLKCSSPSNDS